MLRHRQRRIRWWKGRRDGHGFRDGLRWCVDDRRRGRDDRGDGGSDRRRQGRDPLDPPGTLGGTLGGTIGGTIRRTLGDPVRVRSKQEPSDAEDRNHPESGRRGDTHGDRANGDPTAPRDNLLIR